LSFATAKSRLTQFRLHKFMLKFKKQEVDIGEHFHKHASEYQEVVHGTNKELYQNISRELNQSLSGTVLDIGNGNVFNYDLSRLEHVIAVDIAFKNMTSTEKITYVTADARDLRGVKTGSCDRVVMQFLVHHIVNTSKRLTDSSVEQCFSECYRVLKPSGKLMIVEMVVHPVVEFFENLLYRMTYRFLSWVNKPMIKFYSLRGIISRLKGAGFTGWTDGEIEMGKWIDPFEALFPGKIKLPRFLYPAECRLISAQKLNP